MKERDWSINTAATAVSLTVHPIVVAIHNSFCGELYSQSIIHLVLVIFNSRSDSFVMLWPPNIVIEGIMFLGYPSVIFVHLFVRPDIFLP